MNDYFEIIKTFVDTANGGESDHFKRTVDWAKSLSNSPSENLLIAAYSHDIERILRSKRTNNEKRTFTDPELLKQHQQKGAEIIEKVLLNNGMESKDVNEVYELISKHEEGGSDDQNVLMCADSLSYFETNATKHLQQAKEGKLSVDSVKDKFDFMFTRINISHAKVFAGPMYKTLVEELLK